MGPSVRIVFLGGLGEIGRNCCCIEVDGRILLVDCGIMFPDADMPGVDLVLPDFTYLRENAERVEAILSHPRGTKTTRWPGILAPRRLGPGLRLGAATLALARNRIEEAGMLDRTEMIPVEDGERAASVRSTASSSRSPTRCRTVSRSRSSRREGTIVHTGDFKLDLTPVDGRRTNLALLGEHRQPRRWCPATDSDSTNAERPGFTPSEATVGAAMRSLFREHADKRFIVTSFASHLHRVRAGRAGRDRATAARSRSSAARCCRTCRWRASAASSTSPASAVIDIEETPVRPRRSVHRLHGFAGRADERALADGRARAQVREDLARRRGRDQRPRDPGQRVERLAGDRLAAPRRRRSRARPHVAGARVRARVAGGAKFMLNLLSPEWFVPVHGEYRHLVHSRAARPRCRRVPTNGC